MKKINESANNLLMEIDKKGFGDENVKENIIYFLWELSRKQRR